MRVFRLMFFILYCAVGYGQDKTIAKYEHLVKYYRYYKQDSAIYFANEGIKWARQNADSTGMAQMLIQSGLIDDNLGEFEHSLGKYRKALEMFTTAGMKDGVATATIRIGVVELRNGKYDNAIKYFLDALRISEQTGSRFGVMEAYYSISWAYLDQKNSKMAMEYLKIAEKINDSIPFSSTSLNIFNHLGVVYRDNGDLKKARYYLEKGVSMSNDMENQGLNITLINNLASVYSKEGNTNKAVVLQKQALERSRALGNYLRELQALFGLSKTYGEKNPTEAIRYLTEAISLAKEKGAYNQEIRYLKAITPLYVAQGNYRQAYLMKEREKTLADSFLYKSMSNNIASLKTEYELSKSNAKITELDLLNNKRQLELRNTTMVRNVTFAGVLLLSIILALLYNQYRIKQRNNREISKKNFSLQHLLDEKEWLLKEVHHRVKNNLHTVMSLLETQSAYLENDALVAVQNSQHRVHAMSLIHQKLYQVENATSIDMSVYLPELLNYLGDSFGIRSHIRFFTNIESIYLDISQAIPVGLILNEAITNSIKYAFPGNMKGEIHIEMIRTGRHTVLLEVADTGVGLPNDWNKLQTRSMGFKLMKGLSDDIHATFTVGNIEGTKISLEFPEEPMMTKHSKKQQPKTVNLP